ncbi:hypothetical protein MTYP_01748 [Methylophilaceae bacterium]|nr:hypothetical protein MTYP_01748 [Methylophilaceae bacterium]
MASLKSFTKAFPGPLAGDWLVITASSLLVIGLFNTLWTSGAAGKLQIRAGENILGTYSLNQQRTIEVPGPLGISRIQIENGKARVASDPSPRQYCVKQGWLSQAGQVAMCLPNQVSIELLGASRPYDSLNY